MQAESNSVDAPLYGVLACGACASSTFASAWAAASPGGHSREMGGDEIAFGGYPVIEIPMAF